MVVRRLGALMMAGALPGLVIASMFVDWRVGGGDYSAVGYAAFALGSLFGLVNFYLSFVRPFVLLASASDKEIARHVSKVPLLGMLTVPALAFLPPSVGLSIACLALIVLDTGNVMWFVVAVWHDESFWSAR